MRKKQPPEIDQEQPAAEAPADVDVESSHAESEAVELDSLEAAQAEVAKLKDENLRLMAEVRNTHQRAQRDKTEALKYAEADFARELLVIVDDLERTQAGAAEADNVAAVADGVRIVYEHFLKVLKARGVEPIAAVGQAFDPHFHEAMLQQPSDEHAAGTVMQELQRGYQMRERILRAARVIVSSGRAGQPAEEQ